MKNRNRIMMGWCALALVILAALATFFGYRRYHQSREAISAAMTSITAYSQYEITDNGKPVVILRKDTFHLSACHVSPWALLPTHDGHLLAIGDKRLDRNPYKKTDPQKVLDACTDSIDSIYKDSRWRLAELGYYVHSHDVKDFGFSLVYKNYLREKSLNADAKKWLDSLSHIKQSRHKLRITHRVRYAVPFALAKGRRRQLACYPQEYLPKQQAWLFQTDSQETPDGADGITINQALPLIRAHSVPAKKAMDLDVIEDSLGRYRGDFDNLLRPNGIGEWMGRDGSYYEGYWKDGKRNGFGYSIAPKRNIHAGEWKNDKYKGEKLVYSSERIYGIDISKYQHEIGKHKYAIDWKRLRITHLGSISHKTISGAVNYPIKFIYVKSTEGATLLNPYYRSDYRAAKAHGFHVGSYHFFSPISPAALQARQFLKHTVVSKTDLPPVLDVEPTAEQIKKMGGTGVLFSRIRTWLRFVEREVGMKPILYINQTFVNRYLNQAPDLKHNYRIWIARYGEYKPDIHLVYWQLCPDGRVSGIHGEVDINVFNGYSEAFNQFLGNR